MRLLYFSVSLDCKKAGLKSMEEQDIVSSIANVSNFFLNLKCVGGQKAVGKSASALNQAGKKRFNSEVGVFTKFWKAVEDYELLHSDGHCMVFSCDELNTKMCVRSLEHPFLVISADDLNCKDFKNQVGRTLLESKASVCVELEGLKREGMTRLVTFLKSAVKIFDSRIRIVVFGERGEFTDIDDFSRNYFEMKDFSQVSKKVKIDSLEVQQVDAKEALKRHVEILKKDKEVLKSDMDRMREKIADYQVMVKQLEEESSNFKEELREKNVQLAQCKGDAIEGVVKNKELVEERSMLQSKMAEVKEAEDVKYRQILLHSKKVTDELFELKKELENDSEKNQKKIENLRKENDHQQDVIEELNKKLEAQSNVGLSASNLSSSSPVITHGLKVVTVETQTEVVEFAKSALSVLKEQLSKNIDSPSAVHQAYRSIKNLKCKEKFTKSVNGVYCELKIIGGNNILKFPDLTNFNAEGMSEKESKNAAFAKFVKSVFDYNA